MESRRAGTDGSDGRGRGAGLLAARRGLGRRSPRTPRSRSSTPPSTPGVTFLDTADVYGDGRSREAHRRVPARPAAPDHGLTVATKMGRRADPHVAEAYTLDAFRAWTDRSRENLGVDTLDLVQLHCPPTEVFRRDVHLRRARRAGRRGPDRGVRRLGRDRRRGARRRSPGPHVATVQIILNVFRRKPLEQVLPAGARPRASGSSRASRWQSGLLSGKYDEQHAVRRRRPPHLQPARRGVRRRRDVRRRAVRRRCRGRARGRRADAGRVRRPRSSRCAGSSTSPGVSVVIPGARTAAQARRRTPRPRRCAPLDEETLDGLRGVYDGRDPRARARALVGALLGREPIALEPTGQRASARAGQDHRACRRDRRPR